MASNVDVVVVGGGNAALCAAIAARQAGAKVLVLERSPMAWRGGNSKYTRNLRCVNDGDGELPGRYAEDEFLDDLARVAASEPYDLDLARLLVVRSRETPAWMERLGVRWQPPLTGTLQLSHSNRFFLGGGKALVNHYYRVLERLGVEVAYESRVTGFRLRAGACDGVVVAGSDGDEIVPAKSVVVASGGFESDKRWLAETWGDKATTFAIRGCAYNDGSLIRELLELDARSVATPGVFHGTAVDRRSPEYDGGIATRVDSIPFGIVVDRNARRFYDEGEDLWPKRYAIWGRLIAEQDGAAAFSIFDARSIGRFIPPLYSPVSAPTLGELATELGLDAQELHRTVAAFNAGAAANREADIDTTRLDGCCTEGVEPRKSNWALPLERPPYYAFPLRTGVTFTYFGVGVDDRARVVTSDGGRLPGLYAAGEVMSGNILRRGYMAGVGMTIGTVFGQLAGEEAARDALR